MRKGQAALYRYARTLDIAAGKTKNRVAVCIMRLVQPGIVKSVVDRRDHIDQRRLRIGDDIGRAAAP